jgi:tetratricopeptide (TPR) repeat protein
VAHAGGFAHTLGDEVAARRLSTEGLQLARTIGARDTAAFALHTLGESLLNEHDPAAARPPLQESLALARQLEDGWATARVLSNLSGLVLEEGGMDLARSLAEEGVAVAQRAGERRIESTILINLASLQVDYLAALTCLEDALAIKRELGDRLGIRRALRGLGWIAFDRGDDLAACRHFCEALAIARDLGVAERPDLDRPSTLAGLACVALRLGDAERALRLFAVDARIAGSGGLQYAVYLSERRRPLLEAARQRLGMGAERLWNEGWALTPDDLEAEVSALAMAAEHARLAV